MAACTDEASEILVRFANEIHYITGSGFDKIVLKSGRNNIHELFLGLEPHEQLRSFNYANQFRFNPICTHLWKNEQGVTRWRIQEEDLSEGWQRAQVIRSKSKSFDLPCVTASYRSVALTENRPFIVVVDLIKRRRKITGWSLNYDRKIPVMCRFLAHFWEDGNLALGEKVYSGLESRPTRFRGPSSLSST